MRYTDDRNHLTVDLQAKECTIPDDERERMQSYLNDVGAAVREFPASVAKDRARQRLGELSAPAP